MTPVSSAGLGFLEGDLGLLLEGKSVFAGVVEGVTPSCVAGDAFVRRFTAMLSAVGGPRAGEYVCHWAFVPASVGWITAPCRPLLSAALNFQSVPISSSSELVHIDAT